MKGCIGVLLAASILTLAPFARGGPIPAAPSNPVVPDRIVFDGASLAWVSASGRTSYAAFSGRADGAATEATVDDGPVPQGKFTVDPANIQDFSSQPADVLREWGLARVPLQLRQSTRRRMLDGLEVDRRGFSIHGGTEKGTKGSIEINNAAVHRSFFDRLRAHGKPIDVEVLYSGEWEQRFELPSCRYPAPVTEPVNRSDVDDPTLAVWSGEFDSPWSDPALALVIDPYGMNSIDWDALSSDRRVAGIIHKATQGTVVDRQYAARRLEARRLGYLWGSYHLATPGDPVGQADFYLDTVKPDETEVIALDLEGLDPCKFMSIGDARRFIERIHERTGRYPLLYANGSVVREITRTYGADSVFARCPLWFARPGPVLGGFPKGFWPTYTLWQFSSEVNCGPPGKGACLYRVKGTRFDMDVNVFFGTVDDLRARWPFRVQ